MEKFDLNRQKPEAFKVLCVCSRNIHQPDRQNNTVYILGQLNNSPIMCILPLQRGWDMKFEFVGSHNQLCTFHTLINWLVTNLFYIHARHRMMEAARHDKNGMLQSVSWSVGCSLSDVTSAWCGSPNQPIRCNQKHWRVFLKIPTQAENCEAANCWQNMFVLFRQSSWSFLKLCEHFAKSY